MDIQYYWDVVNGAESLEELKVVEKILDNSDISNEDYDDLMDALSYKVFEAYRMDRY